MSKSAFQLYLFSNSKPLFVCTRNYITQNNHSHIGTINHISTIPSFKVNHIFYGGNGTRRKIKNNVRDQARVVHRVCRPVAVEADVVAVAALYLQRFYRHSFPVSE